MNRSEQAEVERALRTSADDHRLLRGERDALARLLSSVVVSAEDVGFVRNQAFGVVREHDLAVHGHTLLRWLEDVMRLLPAPATTPSSAGAGEAHFSPGEACRARIVSLIDGARRSVDICVFTVTDDSISDRIVAAHRRGVSVRVITDNDKSLDEGSDARRLAGTGIPVRVDESEHHMHHKYAVFDGEVLLTGSYNWTRSAALYNRENLLVTREPSLVGQFRKDFETLWGDLARWSSS